MAAAYLYVINGLIFLLYDRFRTLSRGAYNSEL